MLELKWITIALFLLVVIVILTSSISNAGIRIMLNAGLGIINGFTCASCYLAEKV